MNTLFKTIGTILKIILGIPCILFLIYLVESGLGFYPGGHYSSVAKIAAEKKDVEICHRIIRAPWLTVMGPTIAERQISCIYEYASLTKDPSACELLMPSSYGMSCVGAAENSQMPCNTNVKPYSVYWRDGEKENTVHIRECLTEKVQRTELGEQCCAIGRIAYLKNDNDCSRLKKSPNVYDRCLYSLAWKLKEPSYCDEVENENAKAACKVQTKAIKENPSFCPGCVQPLESIDELQ